MRSRRAAVLAILTIAAGLFVLGFFLMVNANLQRLVGRWSEAAELSVYLRGRRHAASSCRRSTSSIEQSGLLATSGSIVSKADALTRFREDFPDLARPTERLERNPFPASIEVRLSPDARRRAAAPSTTLATRARRASRASPTSATTAGG